MTFHKVIWNEGMFLLPHHFQQQTRHFEWVTGSLFGLSSPYHWGFAELKLDATLLRQGKLGITKARGTLPDHTLFEIPFNDSQPPLLEMGAEVRNQVVYLGLPHRKPGGVDLRRATDQAVTRYVLRESAVVDDVTEQGGESTLELAAPDFRLLLGSQDLSGYAVVPVARVVEVRSDGSVQLDDAFIPTCVDITASERLRGFLSELSGYLHQRAEAIAARISDGGRMGSAEVGDWMFLQIVNRHSPLVLHLMQQTQVHPHTLYLYALQLAGELATFSQKTRRPPDFPLYKHDELAESFTPLIDNLRFALSLVPHQTAVQIPLTERGWGIRVGLIADRTLIGSAQFVLAVKADVQGEKLRQLFPGKSKLGAVEKIRELVMLQLPGVTLIALPTAPRQITYHSGFVYFQLDTTSDHWRQLATSGGIALHVGDEFPGLELELWAIRV